MIEESGTVIGVKPNGDQFLLSVETQIKTTCSTCSAQENCGTSSVAKAFSERKNLVTVLSNKSVEVGQVVKLGLAESAVLSASLLLYLIPLISAIVFAVVADQTRTKMGIDSELISIVALVFGGYLGFLYASKKLNSDENNTQYQVQLLDICPNVIPVKQIDGD